MRFVPRSADFEIAKALDCTIKLLGVSEITPDGTLQAFVSPTLVPLTNAVGNVNGATNVVQVCMLTCACCGCA